MRFDQVDMLMGMLEAMQSPTMPNDVLEAAEALRKSRDPGAVRVAKKMQKVEEALLEARNAMAALWNEKARPKGGGHYARTAYYHGRYSRLAR